MEFIYPIFIAFIFVFISELGDKTQLLVLSFSAKLKTYTILIGVALGSFLSHGIAILFGSTLGSFENIFVHQILEFVTYLSFIVFGLLTFFQKEKPEESKKDCFTSTLSRLGLNYILLIAFTIAIGELGDKTFLASIGLGIKYPSFKISLIIGAILGMVISDSIAIVFGKFLSKKISASVMQKLSGIIFLLFGVVGFIHFFSNLFFNPML